MFFLCFGRLLPNCGKSRSFHPFFRWVSLPFSCSYSALGRSIRDNCWISCNFYAFPTAGKPQFYDFIALREPRSQVSFVHCQGFLRNLSMSLHTNRWHMAYCLCNFQSFRLLWAASARFLISCSFHPFNGFPCRFPVFPFNGFPCRFLVFPLLWGAPSGKTADKTAVSNAFLHNISWKECKPLRSDVSTGIYTHTQLACHFDAYLVSLLKTSHHQMAGFDDSRDIRCSYAICFQWHISAISMWPYIDEFRLDYID